MEVSHKTDGSECCSLQASFLISFDIERIFASNDLRVRGWRVVGEIALADFELKMRQFVVVTG